MLKIMSNRMTSKLEEIMNPGQYGFRPHKRSSQATTGLLTAINTAHISHKPLQIIALDAKAAFDTIYPLSIADAMSEFGIPPKLIEYIHQLTKDGVARIKINNTLSDQIHLLTGDGQGDPLSSLRYIIGQEPFNQVI